MTKFVLIAAMLSSFNNYEEGTAEGYRTSTVQNFSSLQECKTIGSEYLDTYNKTAVKESPYKGLIKCVELVDGVKKSETVLFNK